MSQVYQYSISEDFPQQKVNVRLLQLEIEASNISTDVEYINAGLSEEDVCDVYMMSELSASDEDILDALVDAHTGADLILYRVWCENCGKWYESYAVSVPTSCEVCENDVVDITNEQGAVRGYVIEKTMPSGHHVFNLDDSGRNRWRRYKQFITFPNKLESIPSSIEFSNVVFDGAANLVVEQVLKTGFLISVTSIGKGANWGFVGVEFDWEAVE